MEIQDLIKYRLISDLNKLTLFLPRKMAKAVDHIEESHLRAIHEDLATAKEFVLYFLSFLSITLFDEVAEVNLSTKILKKLLYPVNYLKVIQACESGTPEKGPFIERGKSYSSGIRSKAHKLTENYSKCRPDKYILKNEVVKKVYLRNRISTLEKEMGNPIIQNLLKFYSNPSFELPNKKVLIQRARALVQQDFKTKKGKRLLVRNKNPDYRFKNSHDLSKTAFAEDHVSQFEYLTTPGLRIPSLQGENAGQRVTDSFALMPSWIRSQVTVNGECLEEVDFKALHPNIVMSIYGGKQKYITHDKVAKELGILNEDLSSFKEEHLKFFNKRQEDMIHAKHGLHEYYTRHEPDMLAKVIEEKRLHSHKITSRRMFSKEVEIMSDCIRKLNEKGIYVLYVYDALICEPSHKDAVIDVMNETAIDRGVFTTAKWSPRKFN